MLRTASWSQNRAHTQQLSSGIKTSEAGESMVMQCVMRWSRFRLTVYSARWSNNGFQTVHYLVENDCFCRAHLIRIGVCFFYLHFTQHPDCFGIRVVIKWLGSLFICISGYLKRCDDHMYRRLADKQMTCCSQQSLLHRLLSCDMLLRIFTDWSTNKANTNHSFWPSAKCIFFCVKTQQIQGNQKIYFYC